MQMMTYIYPKIPWGLNVNGLCFSPNNVFSIRCIYNQEMWLEEPREERERRV